MFHNLTSNMTVDNSFTTGLSDFNPTGFPFFGCHGKDEQGVEPRKGCSEADEVKVTAVRKASAG